MLRQLRPRKTLPIMLATAACLALGLQQPASAAEAPYTIQSSTTGLYTYPGNGHDRPFDDEADGIVGNDRGYVGPIKLSRGGQIVRAYCLDLEHGLAQEYASDPQDVLDETTERQRVEVAYILANWGDTDDDVRAAAVQIAIWKLFDGQHFAPESTSVAPATELTELLYATIANAPDYAESMGNRLRAFASAMLKDAAEKAVLDPAAEVEWATTAGGIEKFRVNVVGRGTQRDAQQVDAGSFSGKATLDGATFESGERKQSVVNGTWYELSSRPDTSVSVAGSVDVPYRDDLKVLYARGESKPKQRLIPFGAVNVDQIAFAASRDGVLPSPTPTPSEPSVPQSERPAIVSGMQEEAQNSEIREESTSETASASDTEGVAMSSSGADELAATGENLGVIGGATAALAAILGGIAAIVVRRRLRRH